MVHIEFINHTQYVCVSFSAFLSRCVKGVCVVLDTQTYRCGCETGYGGALCNNHEASTGSCRGLLCLHGQCQKTEDGESCICEQGYTGESCDIGEESEQGAIRKLRHYSSSEREFA